MQTKVPVIIIGAGPVGLMMALCLAAQGVQSTVIEKHPHTTNHPKARGVNGRSMEIFRQLGLEEALCRHELPKEATRFIWLEDFQGKEVTRVESHVDYTKHSPTTRALIAQHHVERELFAMAKQNSLIELRFNTKMINASQDENLVRVTLHDKSNQSQVLEGKYLVAADGAYSPLRELFGVKMLGQDDLGQFCNIYCEMNLNQYVAHRPCVGFMFTREDLMGTFLLANKGFKRWLVGVRLDEAHQTQEDFDDETCLKLVKNIIRNDSIKVKLINKGFWTMAALIAENYQVGRLFFIGDAAHRLPPTGGFGMNTGIQDAHNLAWKLALVLANKAEEKLLMTYGEERAPIAHTNIQWSSHNAQRFHNIYTALAENDTKTFEQELVDQSNHLNSIHLDLGFVYGKDYADKTDFIQTATVGARAPHCWLKNQQSSLSTLDLFLDSYTLLCSPKAIYWQQYFKQHADYPLNVITIGTHGDYEAVNKDFLSLYGIDESGAVLVRPDGHVAWHGIDDTQA